MKWLAPIIAFMVIFLMASTKTVETEQTFPPIPVAIEMSIPATQLPEITKSQVNQMSHTNCIATPKIKRESLELPDISTESKLFTDYRFYNIPGTPHNRLQQKARTDSNGLRRFNNDYIVAMGSYYSTSIGDRFRVELSSGRVFTVIFGDGKWGIDCDSKNMYTPVKNYDGETVGNLLEFIVDEDILDPNVYSYGGIERLDIFKGDVVRIWYIGRDDSEDWDTYF